MNQFLDASNIKKKVTFLQRSFTLDLIILKQSLGQGSKLDVGEYRMVKGPQDGTLKYIIKIKISCQNLKWISS